ncbi:site-specific DNA-methyltransferase [Mesomycoplasma hyorhinis]|uniref:site-specific DNA-methyltransferase n=1 Tax=Mesomycoplasma hyorhinis TaxID=2100 RepID=UPI00280C32F8|nr:site-specific DNA-methyltransferase [Mesomycoplasma hyorhinis]
MIYIDPPYNTQKTSDDGNNLTDEQITADKFIYRDKFSRTGWLNLLNERLKLAKQLLKEDGVILVSIDDNEQAYLKVLMDEIFGEENFIAPLVWVSNKSGRQITKHFATTFEYILVYAKNEQKLNAQFKYDMKFLEKLMPSLYDEKKADIFEDEFGKFFLGHPLEQTNNMKFNIQTSPSLFFPIYTDGKEVSLVKKSNFFELFPPKNRNGVQGVWRWSREKLIKENKNIFVKKVNDSYEIYPKRREFTYRLKNIIISSSISTTSGVREIWNILKDDSFTTPKPVSLLKLLISLKPKENTRVLDFFAGSGTTGQAVLELNKEDGGNRSFVLVTNNENNIGQSVTYERLYRINKGEGTKGQKDFEWIKKNEAFDTSLNVFWSKTYNTSLLNNNITNQELKDKFIKLLKDFGINKDKEKIDDSVLKTLSSLRPYKEENKGKTTINWPCLRINNY